MKVWEKNMAPITTPENSPRLFDMVRVKDDSVRTAFYFALRDTLVAQDMDQATRMAFQRDRRWRVVTLKGQIIEMAGGWFCIIIIIIYLFFFSFFLILLWSGVYLTGTMTGGGRVLKGRMSSSIGTEVSQEEVSAKSIRWHNSRCLSVVCICFYSKRSRPAVQQYNQERDLFSKEFLSNWVGHAGFIYNLRLLWTLLSDNHSRFLVDETWFSCVFCSLTEWRASWTRRCRSCRAAKRESCSWRRTSRACGHSFETWKTPWKNTPTAWMYVR